MMKTVILTVTIPKIGLVIAIYNNCQAYNSNDINNNRIKEERKKNRLQDKNNKKTVKKKKKEKKEKKAKRKNLLEFEERTLPL